VCSGTGKVLQAAKEKQKDLKDKLFNLANEFAISNKEDVAVRYVQYFYMPRKK
jgi:hypothetical protein